MIMKTLILMAAALSAQNGFIAFESNGVRGAYALADKRIVVLATPSSCDVESLTLRMRLRKPGAADWRLVVSGEPVFRCQAEPVAFVVERDRTEEIELLAIQELEVKNNAAAPLKKDQ